MRALRLFVLGVGSLTFILFSYWQLNDARQYGNGDAWLWIGIYAFTAGLTLCLGWCKMPMALLSSWVGFAGGALLFRLQDAQGNILWSRLAPANFWQATDAHIVQQANEAGGLLVVGCWALLLMALNRS